MMKKYASIMGVVGLALIIIGLFFFSMNGAMGVTSTILLSLGCVGVVAFVALKFNEIKSGLTSRSAKFGTNAAFMIIFLLGILIVVNMLAMRFSYRADTTAAKLFSLADQTKKVLKGLETDINVIGFFKTGEEAQAKELMEEYNHVSPRFKFEFVDPDKKPGLTKQNNVTTYGTVIIRSGAKEERIETVTEEELTNAVIQVTREGVKTIYFTTGHGERGFDDVNQTGLSSAKEGILAENYQVEQIMLASAQDSVPANCTVLVIAGPKSELFPNEKTKIDNYLNRGGKVLMMLDTDAPQTYCDLANEWGIEVGNDIIVDASGVGQLFGAGPTIPIVSQYEEHTITKDFGVMTFFPEARSVIKAGDAASELTVTELAKTSQRSWAEKSPLTSNEIAFDEGVDVMGPISILAVAEKTAQNQPTAPVDLDASGSVKSRLAVFGDVDFATNSYINVQGNNDFFLNTVSWLAEQEDLISVRAKDPEDRRLNLTQKQSKMILYFGVLLLPSLVFALGILVYIKRK